MVIEQRQVSRTVLKSVSTLVTIEANFVTYIVGVPHHGEQTVASTKKFEELH